jgi:HTH-type transcriptional regulator/antitoxin HigA
MKGENNLKPFLTISVGDMIKRELEYLGWSQEDLAQITDISRKTLSNIMNAKQKLLLEHAVKLSDALGGSPESWMNLDTRYWINQGGKKDQMTATERKARIRKYVPVLEIQKKGWYPGGRSADDYEAIYQSIWDSRDPDFTFEVYEKEAKYCARRTKSDVEYTRNYSITWYQIARKNSAGITVGPYDPEKLARISGILLGYTTSETGVVDIINDLNSAGVKFLVQAHLSKTYLDGACFFHGGNPVIVYTARYDRIDNFWFTLAHEIAHLLLHFKKSTDGFFLDDLMEKGEKTKQEQEADTKAEAILNVQRILELAAPYRNYLSEVKLKAMAAELNVEISLLLGVLQFHGYIDYRKLNKYKKPVKELIPQSCIAG